MVKYRIKHPMAPRHITSSAILQAASEVTEVGGALLRGARSGHPDDRPITLLMPDGIWAQARKLVQREPALIRAEHAVLPGATHPQ